MTERFVADPPNRVVRRIHPDGTIDIFAGNGTDVFVDSVAAINSGIRPENLEVGPNGSVYVADFRHSRISRVDANGLITAVAGNGQCTSAALPPDGSVATAVELCNPEQFAVGPDGTLYIANDDAVLRVGPDGLLYRVAGLGARDGVACYYEDFGFNEICRDEILATRARIGLVGGVALGPDGSLYVGDIFAAVIRRVTPDGLIHRFAGTGDLGFSGDGGAALDATMDEPSDIFVAPDGVLYFNDDGDRIRKVTTGGTILTVAGTLVSCQPSDNPCEGAPALQAERRQQTDGERGRGRKDHEA